MKIKDIFLEDKKGTYAGVRFSKQTLNYINKFIKENKIPDPQPDSEMHTTLLYSRKHLLNYKPMKYKPPLIARSIGFDLFGEKKNHLVIKLECSPLYQRHHKLVQMHGATYDFDRYEPHITLSKNAVGYDLSKLPEFTHDIKIIGEYMEEVDD